MTNESCSKSKCCKMQWIMYSLLMVLLPIFLIIAIIQFAPIAISKLFLDTGKIRSIIEYEQKSEELNRVKKGQGIIKKDFENPNGNLLHNPLDPSIGNKDAKLTIIEYIDYKCGYCKKAHEEVSQLLSQSKYKNSVRVIVKNYPIIGGEASLYAAEVATAFYQVYPEKFAQLHSKLFASSLSSKSDVDGILKSFDTSYEKIKNDKVRDSIMANFNFAREIGVGGTPTFIIGDGELISGFASAEQLSEVLDRKLNPDNGSKAQDSEKKEEESKK